MFAHDHRDSRDEVFVLCCFGLQTKLAASPGFAPGPPVSETGALLIMQRGNGLPSRSPKGKGWLPGKVLPLRFLGVGQT